MLIDRLRTSGASECLRNVADRSDGLEAVMLVAVAHAIDDLAGKDTLLASLERILGEIQGVDVEGRQYIHERLDAAAQNVQEAITWLEQNPDSP